MTPSHSLYRSSRRLPLAALVAAAALVLSACSPAAPQETQPATSAPATQPHTPLSADPTASPTEAGAPAPTAASPTASTAQGSLRFVLDPAQSEARYLVNEQLAGFALPSDAVGVTQDISGVIVIGADGVLAPGESNFVVDLRTLRSDSGMRDGYVDRNTLQTQTYPMIEFVPTSVAGLPSPLPESGSVTFQLIGDLSLHGQTRRVAWEVTAELDSQALIGTAATAFTFADFGLEQPRVSRVLSVDETIRLEIDFHMLREQS